MKAFTLLALAGPVALAFPSVQPAPKNLLTPAMVPRQSSVTITDNYLFSLTLPQFTTKRNARDPASLDWATDGCSMSPDNPLGFPFLPACHRHDFGYRNYRNQGRFTEPNRKNIDDQFKEDLYFQCRSVDVILRGLCEGLADVYYAAVRAFGGSGATKRDSDADNSVSDANGLLHEYEEAVAAYEQMLQTYQAAGLIDAPAAAPAAA